MKSMLLSLLGAFGAFSVCAAEIKGVIVRQQWPWSTAVRVEYVLTGVERPVDIEVEVFDGETHLVSETLVSALSGDVYGVVRDGAYVLEVDPVEAFGASRSVIADFRVKLGVKESSAEMIETVYRIFDLTKNNAVSDVRRADLLNGTYGAIETDYRKIVPGSPVADCLVWTGVTNNPIYKTTHLVMRKINAAGKSYTMGASNELGQKYADGRNFTGYEKPHQVSFTNDFYIAVFPTTKFQHKLIVGQTPDVSDVSLRTPAQSVLFTDLRGFFHIAGNLGWWPDAGTWSSAGSSGTFVPNPDGSAHDVESKEGKGNALHRLRTKTGERFDLPTEARWEFCCRAGTTTATYAGNLTAEDSGSYDPVVDLICWYGGNSGNSVKEVGLKVPNPWGLYDMLGNVEELCLDVSKTDMSSAAVIDPPGDTSANTYARRMTRGGNAFIEDVFRHRCAFRGYTVDPHDKPLERCGYRLMYDVK